MEKINYQKTRKQEEFQKIKAAIKKLENKRALMYKHRTKFFDKDKNIKTKIKICNEAN